MIFNLFAKFNFKDLYNKFYNDIVKLIIKLKSLVKTNYDLGLYHLNRNNLDDAILRFKIVTYFDKLNSNAHYLLGKSQFLKGKLQKAEKALIKALELNQDIKEALYFLALTNDKYLFPDRIPLEIIKDYYDKKQYNSIFNNDNKLSLLIEDISKYITEPRKILDLGFGEGDIGYLLKNKFNNCYITGIEISEYAIKSVNQKIDNKIIYNSLIEDDFYNYLLNTQINYDMIFALNSLCFDKNLEKIFNLVKNRLTKDGIFIFELEESVNIDNEINLSKKYFTYNRNYINEILEKSNLKIMSLSENDIKSKVNLIYICKIN